ncbi:hypothetical protein BYT27DRAFT_7180355 [Phlegmacium glaucopus]|nr:hypothetical protein BYT27DRAFT_7180355 [Phlegmacium glaucopus]
MFQKGPRFEQLKVPDVPGPGSYNTNQDTVENYKRGAFLEKTDRFVKDPLPQSAERYAALQKKVEDLEKLHLQEKKSHNAQLERLKQDIAHSRSQAAEHSEQAEKQGKHNTALEAIIHDLKKNSASDQADLKDSRHKLRLLEAERDRFLSKQPELVEIKKSLSTLESKRKDELKERDRRIADLEKQLLSTTKAKDLLETRFLDLKRISEQQLSSTRTEMETLLEQARSESRLAKEETQNLKTTTTNREEHVVRQLEDHRRLLDRVVREYAYLASRSVSSTDYHLLKQTHFVLQLRQLRLERKLLNAEGQVVELTHLIRQAKEENLQLSRALSDALDEISILRTATSAHDNIPVVIDDTNAVLDSIHNNIVTELVTLAKTDASTHELLVNYYQSQCADLCLAFSVMDKELEEIQVTAGRHAIDLASALTCNESITSRLESLQKEYATQEEEAKLALATINGFKTSTVSLEAKVVEMQQKLDNGDSIHANNLKKEKDTIQRLNTTIQKSRMAEEALREEIDELTAALTNAECYQEAYYSLSNEIGSLLTRNQIAEEEVNRISQFNAEILGHNNPAQRIMYVDRIRRELAEAKQEIAVLTHEQENIVAHNNDLEHELDMYKSVRVTNITRVGRII